MLPNYDVSKACGKTDRERGLYLFLGFSKFFLAIAALLVSISLKSWNFA
jgi:hypothetical protein